MEKVPNHCKKCKKKVRLHELRHIGDKWYHLKKGMVACGPVVEAKKPKNGKKHKKK